MRIDGSEIISCQCATQPKVRALANITGLIAELGLNVLDVEHHRVGVAVGIDQVELLLTLETRDPAHRLVAVDRLRSSGYAVDLLA